jgi:hypothetical protein
VAFGIRDTSKCTIYVLAADNIVSRLLSIDQIKSSKQLQGRKGTVAESGIDFPGIISLERAVFILMACYECRHLVEINCIYLIKHSKDKESV